MQSIDSYLFLLKKFVGGIVMPVPLTLLLLVWTLLFLLRRKTRWLGILCVALATALLFVASYPPLSAKLTGPLEQQYPSYQPSGIPAEFVAVLGHAHSVAAKQPITSELSPTGVVRISEGIRIYRLNPGSKLVFTGYHAKQTSSYVDKAKELAIALGVPATDILSFDGPKDTTEEAALLAQNFAGRRLVLVTSAAHMPRAMVLFAQHGLNPAPAPTNHMGKPVQSKWRFPRATTLYKTAYWLHEKLGLLWSQLVNKPSAKPLKAAGLSHIPAPTPPELLQPIDQPGNLDKKP